MFFTSSQFKAFKLNHIKWHRTLPMTYNLLVIMLRSPNILFVFFSSSMKPHFKNISLFLILWLYYVWIKARWSNSNWHNFSNVIYSLPLFRFNYMWNVLICYWKYIYYMYMHKASCFFFVFIGMRIKNKSQMMKVIASKNLVKEKQTTKLGMGECRTIGKSFKRNTLEQS